MKRVVYTADDEEPKCGLCEHFCDDYDCAGKCGPNHAWNGYERVELHMSRGNTEADHGDNS